MFPTTPKANSNFSKIFSEEKSFNIQELLHASLTFVELSPCTLPGQELSKTPRTQSGASRFGGSHNYRTNYLPSYIDLMIKVLVNTDPTL
jgi:hypothetical protein